MIIRGVFVRSPFEELPGLLVQRLNERGPNGLVAVSHREDRPLEVQARIRITRWSEQWSRLQIEGAQEGMDLLMESLVEHRPLEEVLVSNFEPGIQEYGYALYKEGRIMERFDSKGPGIESIHFISEVRRVPLQNLMDAARFMKGFMEEHGIMQDRDVFGEGEEEGPVFIDLTLPGKPTFLQALLGAASRR